MEAIVFVELKPSDDLVAKWRSLYVEAQEASAKIGRRFPVCGAGELHEHEEINVAIEAKIPEARAKAVSAMKGWNASGDTTFQIYGTALDGFVFKYQVKFSRG